MSTEAWRPANNSGSRQDKPDPRSARCSVDEDLGRLVRKDSLWYKEPSVEVAN